MGKPEHQWEAGRFRAVRSSPVPEAWAELPRAEVFELRSDDGITGAVRLSTTQQEVSATLVTHERDALVFAIKAWLIARGAREIDARSDSGEVLASGPIDPDELARRPAAIPAARLITLCPSNAELVEALGCFDRVIACEDSTDWPEAAAERERLGPDLGPDLDRVAALEPDLVLSSLSVPGMERIVTGLHRRQIPQIVLAPRSVDDVLREIEAVGQLLGASEAAREACDQMIRERESLRRSLGPSPLRVYLEWWPRPMFTPGADCYSNELIELAGGVNVFAHKRGSSVEVSPEDVVLARPDVCFVSWCGVAEDKLDPENLIKRPGLEALQAAHERHVYRLDERFSGRPGPRMLKAARIMATAIERARRSIELDRTWQPEAR
ncbi:MAG: ABC transporter substrate-binding protein [Myxococcales bacterium]|nr:ABC transporter substrate-binding protein [Myxococcales bacterium]